MSFTDLQVAPPLDMHFNDAVNTVQMAAEQVHEVAMNPTANFNPAVGQGYNLQLQANANAAPGQPEPKPSGIDTGHPLEYGLENVDYNFHHVQTVGLLGDCMGAMGKLCQDVRDGPQLLQPVNQTQEPAHQVDALQPAPENTRHTQLAQLELNQFSPSGPGMAA